MEVPEGGIVEFDATFRLPNRPTPPGERLLLMRQADRPEVAYNPWPRFLVIGFGVIVAVSHDTPFRYWGRLSCEPPDEECMTRLMADLQPVARAQLQDFLVSRRG